ncbi:MAG: hypothetical protein NTW86_27650 [Candidatus Sumerlaeota bacterium]|nr:hypothetical protein [Candidatus Sumerlaeota bacterium]
MADDDLFRMDKTVISVGSLYDEPDEKAYWLSKSPEERFRACEITRRIAYGYDPSTTRLQRLLEVVERSPR